MFGLGGGYGIFSDPDGDRRHFNRDVYGIWFTSVRTTETHYIVHNLYTIIVPGNICWIDSGLYNG